VFSRISENLGHVPTRVAVRVVNVMVLGTQLMFDERQYVIDIWQRSFIKA
jgi:hypothetical protein